MYGCLCENRPNTGYRKAWGLISRQSRFLVMWDADKGYFLINAVDHKDIALIGFDFIDNTGLISPTITTITQPIENIGSIVAKRLLTRIKTGEETEQGEQIKDIAQKIILSPEILEGESSRYVKGE